MNNLETVSSFTFGLQALITLFVILDPVGAVPIFLSLVGNREKRVQRKLALQGATSSLLIICTFAIFGQIILNYLHISLSALQGAGGFLLFLTSMQLLTGTASSDEKNPDHLNIAMVPIGTPLLAGPGAIVTTMLYARYAHTPSHKFALGAAIVGVHLLIALALYVSTSIMRIVRPAGVQLITRVVGLLVAALATEMIVTSIKGFFNL